MGKGERGVLRTSRTVRALGPLDFYFQLNFKSSRSTSLHKVTDAPASVSTPLMNHINTTSTITIYNNRWVSALASKYSPFKREEFAPYVLRPVKVIRVRCHLQRGDWSFHLTNEKKKKLGILCSVNRYEHLNATTCQDLASAGWGGGGGGGRGGEETTFTK